MPLREYVPGPDHIPKKDRLSSEQKLKICQECPFFKKDIQLCTQCGCFTQTKLMLSGGHCPIGKF